MQTCVKKVFVVVNKKLKDTCYYSNEITQKPEIPYAYLENVVEYILLKKSIIFLQFIIVAKKRTPEISSDKNTVLYRCVLFCFIL